MSLQQTDQVKHPGIKKQISFRIQKSGMLLEGLDGIITFNRFLLSRKMTSCKDMEFTVKVLKRRAQHLVVCDITRK